MAKQLLFKGFWLFIARYLPFLLPDSVAERILEDGPYKVIVARHGEGYWVVNLAAKDDFKGNQEPAIETMEATREEALRSAMKLFLANASQGKSKVKVSEPKSKAKKKRSAK